MPNEIDLTQLSEDELAEYLLLLEEEKEMRTTSPITFFEPHPGQQRYFDGDLITKITVIEAGNRGGKSELGAEEAVASALGVRPWLPEGHEDYYVKNSLGHEIQVPNKGLIAGESFNTSVRKTLVPKVLGLLPPDMVKSKRKNQSGVYEFIELTNGSTISFMAYNQDPAVYEGTDWHWAWFDEPAPYPLYEATLRGLVDHAGRMWFTLTPLAEPWIHQELTSKAGMDSTIRHIRFSALDNPHIPRSELMAFFMKIRDPAIREARMHGTPLHLQGLVFPEWRPEAPFWIPFKNPPAHWPRIMGNIAD
jgi:phage terminase large subunit-like protein